MDGLWGRLGLFYAAILVIFEYRDINQSSLLEHPLTSQFLVPFLSAIVAIVSSFVIRRVFGGPGRFDDDGRARRLEESSVRTATRPKKPFRGSWYLLSFLITCRLYLLYWLQPRFKCSYTGVEAFLPVLLAVYDGYWYLVGGRTDSDATKEDEEDDDMALDTFEVLAKWFLQSPLPSVVGAFALTWGFIALTATTATSTIICPASVSPSRVLFWQILCLVLDAVILTLAWRIVQWTRSTDERLQSLAFILLTSTTFSGVFLLIRTRTLSAFETVAARSFNSLDFIHITGESIMLFSILAVLFTTLSSPLAVSSVLIFLCGAYSAPDKLRLLGTFEQIYKSEFILGASALGLGFTVLAYRNRIRHIGIGRAIILTAAICGLIGATIYCAFIDPAGRHTVDKIIYSTRTEVQRWLVQDAKVSESLGVAVKEYQARHNGRKPPPNFDVWYDFATARDSAVIDHFRQIDEDLEPFWSMDPRQISEGSSKLKAIHDIQIVSIRSGAIAPQALVGHSVIDELMEQIQPFAKYLPDMDLPVSLLGRPIVLPPWTQITLGHQDTIQDDTYMWAWEHQHQLGQACPPKTPASAGFYSPTAQFCGACVRPHSLGQFPTTASLSRDLCHQPDMFNMHSFYMDNHPLTPFKELVPVFSKTKTNQYKDILMPLSRGNKDYEPAATDEKSFTDKQNQFFWRGAIGAVPPVPPNLVRGGHQERLSHLLNNASVSDKVTVLLPKDPHDEDWMSSFQYEVVSLQEMNKALKLDAGISEYWSCIDRDCGQFKLEFGEKDKDADGVVKMDSRYVMVMDEDDGPSWDLPNVLRSNSVPLVGSVFKHWYSERIFPWWHYVPVDLRFHGLHSTLSYFMGLSGAGLINNRKVPMEPRLEDAKSIAQEGKQWASRALRREDAAIYLFRLLLEWGRVIDEKRDSIGFEIKGDSESGSKKGT